MKTQEEIKQLAKEKCTTLYNGFFGYIQGYTQCQEDNNKEEDWTNFEGELMDWAHQLGQEQKYIPFPVQVLEWLKNNYKLPQKK